MVRITGIEETYYISNAIIKIVLKICVTNFLSPELYNRTYYHISTIGCLVEILSYKGISYLIYWDQLCTKRDCPVSIFVVLHLHLLLYI